MGCGDRIKTKPPRVFCFRGGNFFVRVNDRFSGSSRDHGLGLESFGRISLFPKVFLPLASSKFFGSGLQYVSRFRKRYLHYSQSGSGQQVFIRWSDFFWFSRINGSRFFGSWSTKGFSRLFGLHYGFSGLWINSISKDLGFGVFLRFLSFGSF
jgi:hypothetical protein